MAYAKKSRRHQASAGLRVTGLPVMFIGRLVITGLLLMSVVLFTVMGLLFNKKTAVDVANCPCLEQADPELTSNSERQLPSNSERQSPSNSERQSPSNSERRLVSNSERQLASNSERQLASATQDSGWGGDIVRLKVTSAPLVDNVTTASERNQEISTDANPNKFKPGWWFSHTRHACKMLGLSTDKQNLKPYMMSKVLVDEKHKILFCQMAKVASTNLGKIFAIIAGKFNGTNPEAIESNDVHGMYNKLQIHLNAFPRDAMLDKLTRYYKFVFVRDPFERLLSGYRNKFLEPSARYFNKLDKMLVLNYRKNATQTGGVTFPEFVTYLVDKERKVKMDGHRQPMYQLCRPCETTYDFIGKINTLGEDISHILKVNNLSGLVDVPTQPSSHSFHKTDLFLGQFYSQVPRPLLSLLHEMYYPDYAIFDFQIPIVIQKLLE